MLFGYGDFVNWGRVLVGSDQLSLPTAVWDYIVERVGVMFFLIFGLHAIGWSLDVR